MSVFLRLARDATKGMAIVFLSVIITARPTATVIADHHHCTSTRTGFIIEAQGDISIRGESFTVTLNYTIPTIHSYNGRRLTCPEVLMGLGYHG